MSIETFARRESMLQLKENLLIAKESRLSGNNGYSIEEVSSMMKAAIKEVLDGKRDDAESSSRNTN